ncbi:hypothetical protein D3C72_1117930 [compost metagenome]
MRHRAHQFALDRQQLLQVLGHAVERRGQPSHRVRATRRHAGFQAALGNARGGGLQATQTPLELAHQQINDQTDQRQAQRGDQHQPLRGIRIHLIQRADFQDPRRADHAGKYPDRIAPLAQRHHGVTLGHPAALVFVHVRLVDSDQAQVEAEALAFLQLRQAQGLVGDRGAHQFIGQQVDGRPGQLLADLLHFPGEHQLFLVADQLVDLRCVRPGLFHQCLTAQHTGALGQVEVGLGKGFQRQRNPQQPLPHQQGPVALGLVHRLQVVGHQRKRAVGQALAVLLAAHLIEQVQRQHTEHRHQNQRGAHAAIDTQEDRVHRVWSTQASGTNR